MKTKMLERGCVVPDMFGPHRNLEPLHFSSLLCISPGLGGAKFFLVKGTCQTPQQTQKTSILPLPSFVLSFHLATEKRRVWKSARRESSSVHVSSPKRPSTRTNCFWREILSYKEGFSLGRSSRKMGLRLHTKLLEPQHDWHPTPYHLLL